MRQGYEDAGTLFAFLDQMNWLPEEVDLEDRSTPVSPVAEYHEQV